MVCLYLKCTDLPPPATDIEENRFPHPNVLLRLEQSFDSSCRYCSKSYLNPEMHNMVLKLHAYRYSGEDWSYTASIPDWVRNMHVQDLENIIEEAILKFKKP